MSHPLKSWREGLVKESSEEVVEAIWNAGPATRLRWSDDKAAYLEFWVRERAHAERRLAEIEADA